MFTWIIILLLIGAPCFCVFMLSRNLWVLRERLNLIYSNYQLYKRLPSYNVMMGKFWIWDVKKFLKGE